VRGPRPKLRRCEVCKGPGPCLYVGPDIGDFLCQSIGRYACQRCHPEPDDSFFADETAEAPAAGDL
jgi:hypothetical protein